MWMIVHFSENGLVFSPFPVRPLIELLDSPGLLAAGRSDRCHLRVQTGYNHRLDQLLIVWWKEVRVRGIEKGVLLLPDHLVLRSIRKEYFWSCITTSWFLVTWINIGFGVFGIPAADKACMHKMLSKLTLHVVQHLKDKETNCFYKGCRSLSGQAGGNSNM